MHVCLHVCTCTACMPGTEGDQKKVPDPLTLDHEPIWELNLSTLQKQLLTALDYLSQLLCMVRVL